MPAFEIAPMTAADIPAIAEIERDSQPQPWSREIFSEELERPYAQILVARALDGSRELLGYICFWEIAGEIQIHNIAVHRARRRHGIGRALLRQALYNGIASKAELAVLEVRRSNEAARRLYESLGFQAVGERPNYYALHEAAIVMELSLNVVNQ